MASPVQDYLLTLPVGTRYVLVLNVAAFVLSSLGQINIVQWCTLPAAVIYHGQLLRLLVPAWLHAGFLHLAMNMSAFVSMGPPIERRLGSLFFLLFIPVLALAGALLGLLLSGALAASRVMPNALQECGIGFSGVLFSLLVLITESQGGRQSLFGVLSVPARAYPWALLLLLQVVLPHISFTGHLSGLLVGMVCVRAGVLLEADAGAAPGAAGQQPPPPRARARACACVDTTLLASSLARLEGVWPFCLARASHGYVPVGGDALFGIELPLHGGDAGGGAGAGPRGTVVAGMPALGRVVPPASHAVDDALDFVPLVAARGGHANTAAAPQQREQPLRPLPLPQNAAVPVNGQLGWSCSACSFINDPGAARCAMCTMPREQQQP
eukprot:g583.t1